MEIESQDTIRLNKLERLLKRGYDLVLCSDIEDGVWARGAYRGGFYRFDRGEIDREGQLLTPEYASNLRETLDLLEE